MTDQAYTVEAPLPIDCHCGEHLTIAVLGIRRIDHHDGRIELVPIIDHEYLARHVATHQPKD